MIFLLVLFLVACSQEASKDDVVELSFMFWGDVQENNALQSMVEQFNEEHDHIQVIPQHVSGEYEMRLTTLMASGELPDVAYVPENLALQWGEDGHIMDLTEKSKRIFRLGRTTSGNVSIL